MELRRADRYGAPRVHWHWLSLSGRRSTLAVEGVDQRANVAAVIGDVHAALSRIAHGNVEAPAEAPKPAVPIRKSVTPDYIICLEDGKKFKSLKRHLRTQYNITPEQYREKWGLPPDYPMVAPNYAKARSQLAKDMGLGQQRRKRRSARG